MAIIKYYWSWIWSAIKGAWGKFAVAMGILTLFTRYIEDKFPERRPSMNTPLWEYPLWVFVITGLIGFLWTPYEKHRRQQQKIKELEAKIGTKQQIRNFVGLASLQTIYVGEMNKSFTMRLDTSNQLELKRLSELPDFDKYLSVEEYPFGDSMLGVTTYKGYKFYPKDALVK